jgi:hypothetical protein
MSYDAFESGILILIALTTSPYTGDILVNNSLNKGRKEINEVNNGMYLTKSTFEKIYMYIYLK